MKIIQISAVVEEGEANEATVFGLGDDNKPYYWGIIDTVPIEGKTVESASPDDYKDVHGWVECGS